MALMMRKAQEELKIDWKWSLMMCGHYCRVPISTHWAGAK